VPRLGQPEVYVHFTKDFIDDDGNVSNDATRKFFGRSSIVTRLGSGNWDDFLLALGRNPRKSALTARASSAGLRR
jgi:hypothetical protein